VPDHNTLCRAAALLLRRGRVAKALDACARWASGARVLKLSEKPLAGDSTYFETHHVSRHYERRCAKARRRWRRIARPCGRSRTIKRLPKLAVTASCASHLILSAHASTGACSDSLHFERLLLDAWRRVPNRSFVAVFDAGYDGEHNHRIARQDMGLQSIIPPLIGRPTRKRPTHWRRHMKRLLATKRSRRRCGYTQRWQVETVMSMIKRNLGAELRGKSSRSRTRDMLLKVLTHNLMIIRHQRRVETEHA
jgi:hypothetical protein